MTDNAVTPEGLDAEYRAGKWSFINDLKEQPRQGAIAAWLVACKALACVLDVGCGEGNLCRYVLPHGVGSWLGIDLSEEALASAARAYPQARFQKADFNTFLPQPEVEYSAIVLNEVLSYTQDQAGQIERYRRWLAPGGVLVLSMYAPARPESGAHVEIARAWAATQSDAWEVLDDLMITSQAKNVTWKLRLARKR